MELGKKQADNENTRMEVPRDEIRISVRGLVEFLLRHGDIDNRHQGGPDNAMQEGSRIHRMIQRRMGAEYRAEVPLKYTHPTHNYVLVVEGRADGIIEQNGEVVIDEIKGTYRELAKMREPAPLHVAQAKCYAYMYALKTQLQEIRIRMTYCNIETEEIRYFYEDYDFKELEDWFQGLMKEYRRWADYSYEWRKIRQEAIRNLEFPFPYREGQRELVSYVYQTIYHSRKLFLEAPTGVGKTISTIFPAVKAMERGMADKIFYLTAKTITRTVAEDTFSLLRSKGLHFKSVILTAKDKICFLGKPECNPESCPYAKGHFDRVNEAMYQMLTCEESFSRAVIETYGQKYQVCPFELCLDMSLFADGVIGDYNYLFDPHVYLKRFFADSSGGNYVFLIDEAHNLLDRGREMYSAVLVKEDFLKVKKELKATIVSELMNTPEKRQIEGQMTLNMTDMSENASLMAIKETDLENENNDIPLNDTAEPDTVYVKGRSKHRGGKSILVRKGYGEKIEYHLDKCNQEMLKLKRKCPGQQVVDSIDELVKKVMRLHAVLDEYLDEQEDVKLPVRDTLLDFFFTLSHYLDIYERLDENYVKYTQIDDNGDFFLKLFCVDPSNNLRECMSKGRSTILFSATFLPIQYYKRLLGGEAEDYEVYARSVFDPEKRGLFVANDVTSRYTRRSEEEYYNIARYIHEIVQMRSGNYMVFCPSYSFLHAICERYEEHFATENMQCICQAESMNEREREEFLAHFMGNEDCDLEAAIRMPIETEEEQTLIGFCVLGGIFGEGIDLKKDSLIGAIIVGTGVPQVCFEREILKNYFDDAGENGFDYSYRYPGMNKVLQAAGRVIRTADDIGMIALLDDRFLQYSYQKMFPREWETYETVNLNTVGQRVERFWDSWHYCDT